ncbi:hypothetical protein [Pseudomonas mediterranea]|uniref:hypothetical protein n=1 Tax=Pseudomonas mediterranea TaxID=183795 RepID=UPI00128F1689|nr:hypothetical protein [Pseudomonas mediterranea]
MQLASALGAPSTERVALQALGTLDQLQKQQKTTDQEEAAKAANSMTVAELGSKIKDGSILANQSPAFNATLQHIYGENLMQQTERDTLAKLQSGELVFHSTEEADAYLTKARNEHLEGQDKYTTAGFDKSWNAFRNRVFDVNAKVMNDQATTRAVQESTDNLTNVLTDVTGDQFKGTTDEAAAAVIQRFQLLSATSLLRDDTRKSVLQSALAQVAATGNKELLDAILKQPLKVGDQSTTVASVVGPLRAGELGVHADSQADKAARQRVDVEMRPFVDQADRGELDEKTFNEWVGKNEKYISTPTWNAIRSSNEAALRRREAELGRAQVLQAAEASVSNAQTAYGVAIDQGNYAFVPDTQVLTPEGKMKDFDRKAFAQKYMAERVAREEMPLDKQVQFYSTNGVENPVWSRTIQAGTSNLASIGWTPEGKPLGQLNEQGQAALETFSRINTANPQYAQQLAGKDYETLSDIQFLREQGGFPDASAAAAVINQVQRSGIKPEDYTGLKASVAKAVDAVVNPSVWDSAVNTVRGWVGNDQTNLTQMASTIRRRAELLVASGQVPDAAAAVAATVEYLKNPSVTTNINNTVYFNKDLPQVPKGEDVKEWMTRFITEVPGKAADENGVGSDNIRLEPNQYGGFTVWTGGIPMVDRTGRIMTYRKEDISRWVKDTLDADLKARIDERNEDIKVHKDFLDARERNIRQLQPDRSPLPGKPLDAPILY